MRQDVLFRSGEGGYHTYRIPALLVARGGAVLAFCEGRRDSPADSGTIHLLLRRSEDGGRTWGAAAVLFAEEGVTCGNPAPVLDPATGDVVLLFCKNLADGPEEAICRGEAPRTVWLARSPDAGRTWDPPVEITACVKRPEWTWYATGPGHGIALRTGRLVVACDHVVGVHLDRRRDPHHSHVVLSDDGGRTWRIGGIVPAGTNESTAAETADGALYINCRNAGPERLRAFAWSRDGGETFAQFGRDPALVEPACHASLARHDAPPGRGAPWVLFSNPSSRARERMTLRASADGCRTWTRALCLHGGPSAYSDLGVAPDGAVLCLYERGEVHPYETLTLARLGPDELREVPGGRPEE